MILGLCGVYLQFCRTKKSSLKICDFCITSLRNLSMFLFWVIFSGFGEAILSSICQKLLVTLALFQVSIKAPNLTYEVCIHQKADNVLLCQYQKTCYYSYSLLNYFHLEGNQWYDRLTYTAFGLLLSGAELLDLYWQVMCENNMPHAEKVTRTGAAWCACLAVWLQLL